MTMPTPAIANARPADLRPISDSLTAESSITSVTRFCAAAGGADTAKGSTLPPPAAPGAALVPSPPVGRGAGAPWPGTPPSGLPAGPPIGELTGEREGCAPAGRPYGEGAAPGGATPPAGAPGK